VFLNKITTTHSLKILSLFTKKKIKKKNGGLKINKSKAKEFILKKYNFKD
jgi:hypothetical protein